MKTGLFATVAAVALMGSPANAADFSIYFSGLVGENTVYQHLTTDADGTNEKIDNLPLAGQRYKGILSFDRMVDEGTGAVSYKSLGVSSDLPFQFYANRGVNQQYDTGGLSLTTVYEGLPGGPANYLDERSFEINLSGLNLLPDGTVASFDVSAFNSALSNGSFRYQFGTGGADYLDLPADYIRANGSLTVDRVSLSPFAAAVPEPASWALMIGGFGLVGGAMRRRTIKASTVRVAYA